MLLFERVSIPGLFHWTGELVECPELRAQALVYNMVHGLPLVAWWRAGAQRAVQTSLALVVVVIQTQVKSSPACGSR